MEFSVCWTLCWLFELRWFPWTPLVCNIICQLLAWSEGSLVQEPSVCAGIARCLSLWVTVPWGESTGAMLIQNSNNNWKASVDSSTCLLSLLWHWMSTDPRESWWILFASGKMWRSGFHSLLHASCKGSFLDPFSIKRKVRGFQAGWQGMGPAWCNSTLFRDC